MNRRTFLASTAGLTPLLAASVGGCLHPSTSHPPFSRLPAFAFSEATIAELQAGMKQGRWTSLQITRAYLARIQAVDRNGPRINSLIEVNPDAEAIAAGLDRERRSGQLRGPLHGIPVVVKDNMDTGDRMMTTAGSIALARTKAHRDATAVKRLREAGGVLLAKANLSEWANFRGDRSSSGWSSRGGQTLNPYVLNRNPSGSSSGSAVAVSANLCAVAVGTETDGSIVSPSAYCGIVGIKPTVGLISRTGIIPISSSQDTAGPMARCVADAAAFLGVMAGADHEDTATTGIPASRPSDYTAFLDRNSLKGARIGVLKDWFRLQRTADPVFAGTLERLRAEGAHLDDKVELPSRDGLGSAEYLTMLFEFKDGLNRYLQSRGADIPVHSLDEVIEFNRRNASTVLPHFGQEIMERAAGKGGLTDPQYLEARQRCERWRDGLGDLFRSRGLDALVAPTGGLPDVIDPLSGGRGFGGSSNLAAASGFPNITVPCGGRFGLPLGLSFIGPAWSEPRLIGLAFAFEQSACARRSPKFLAEIDPAGAWN